LENPGDNSEDLALHLHQCAGCRQFSRHNKSVEQDLVEAIDLDTPENLASKILLRQSTSIEITSRKRKRRLAAMAATVLLSTALVGIFVIKNNTSSLEATVLAHIHGELNHLNDISNVPLTEVNKILIPLGSKVSAPIGMVHYAGACRIRNRDGAHLVVAGDEGDVTLFCMPGDHIFTARRMTDDRFTGIIVPMRNGSVAIVGDNIESVKSVEDRLRAVGSLTS